MLEALQERESIERRDLSLLSQVELARLVLGQQKQALTTTLTTLEQQVAVLEAQVIALRGLLQSTQTVVALVEAREEATRQALRSLHSPERLARSRLALLMARVQGVQPTGQVLQSTLNQAIERLKPAAEQSKNAREWRHYQILRLTYQERWRAANVAKRLAISERQYYRELKAAIRTVANLVLGSEGGAAVRELGGGAGARRSEGAKGGMLEPVG